MLRIVLQVVLFFFMLGTVIALGTPQTGAAEKAVLVGLFVLQVWLAIRLRTWRSGPRSSSASTRPA
jgi:hypothetical protein